MLPFLYLSYIILGVLPCIVWLLFYLRQDVHPEDNSKVMEIFFLGMAMVIPAAFLEYLFFQIFPGKWTGGGFLFLLLGSVFGVALVEEVFKYLPVRFRVIKTSHFDEPVDAMLYLIISALGFATVENIFAIFGLFHLKEIVLTTSLRFFTAIFVHTLSSAIVGYFLAISLNKKGREQIGFLAFGIALASFFHGVYNVFIQKLEKGAEISFLGLPFLLIILMAILVFALFSKVKKMPSTCKLK